MTNHFDVDIRRTTSKLASSLKDSYNLSDYESLKIALSIEQNEILARAFVLTTTDEVPTALEAISIAISDNNL